jgi:hypothetical protein
MSGQGVGGRRCRSARRQEAGTAADEGSAARRRPARRSEKTLQPRRSHLMRPMLKWAISTILVRLNTRGARTSRSSS